MDRQDLADINDASSSASQRWNDELGPQLDEIRLEIIAQIQMGWIIIEIKN